MAAKKFSCFSLKISQLLILGASVLCFSSAGLAKKVFQYSENSSPVAFDPVGSSDLYANKIVTSVFDTLFEYKYLQVPYELKPNLAEAMPEVSKDGLTYVIKIKKGVLFQDDACFPGGKGREVTADDFVYSIKRHFDPAERSKGEWLWLGKIVGLDDWKKAGADYKKTVEGLRSLDRYTIQVKLVKRFPQVLYTFAMGFSAVVPEEAVKKYGREFSVHPVGSGAWILQSHNTKKTVLVKNPNYRKVVVNLKDEGYQENVHGFSGVNKIDGKTLPIVDVVEIHWIKEMIARWNSFTKGNEIMWTVLQNEQMDEVIESKSPLKLRKKFSDKYHFRSEDEAGLIFTTFNMDNPSVGQSKDPETNKRNRALRCAIRKAISWPEKINRFYLGVGEAFPGFIPRILDGYDSNLSKESVTQDIEGAKKLLADNGWNSSNLPTLEYGSVASVRDKQIFEHFRGNLAQIGYPQSKVILKTAATFGDFSKEMHNRGYMLMPFGWGLDYPDAENVLALFYGPFQSPGANHANYVNPEYDKLFEQASTMLPSPERTELYKKLNKIIIDDCVTISGFSRNTVYLWHKNAIIWPKRDVIGSIFKYLDVE